MDGDLLMMMMKMKNGELNVVVVVVDSSSKWVGDAVNECHARLRYDEEAVEEPRPHQRCRGRCC